MQRSLLTQALLQGFATAPELARAAGVSLDTARRYRRGTTYPDALTVARLMRQSWLVVDAMLRMAGLDDLSLDQEQARLVAELTALQQQRTARHANRAVALATLGVRADSLGGAVREIERDAGAAGAAQDAAADGGR